jgi:hypothetical protein
MSDGFAPGLLPHASPSDSLARSSDAIQWPIADVRCQKARSRRRSCLAAPCRMPASSDIRHLTSDI